jgi:hypothetical protein
VEKGSFFEREQYIKTYRWFTAFVLNLLVFDILKCQKVMEETNSDTFPEAAAVSKGEEQRCVVNLRE